MRANELIQRSLKSDSLKVVTSRYLKNVGVKTGGIHEQKLLQLEKISQKSVEIYRDIGGKLSFLRHGEELDIHYVNIPDDLILKSHKNTKTCPGNIIEITPTADGCHINCQYCLAHKRSDKDIFTGIFIYRNYSFWLREQLKKNRVENDNQKGTMYYYSPKTEAFSPALIKEGVVEGILLAFRDHVIEEKRRLGKCPDTLMIVTKAGFTDIKIPGPLGYSIIDLLKSFPDNVQISTSITYLGQERDIRAAIEPGAKSINERLEMVKFFQSENILVQGALTQPLFHVFPPDRYFWKSLYEVGIRRISIDLLTLNLETLNLVAQIIGWFDKKAEKEIWESYLNTDAPSKDGYRIGISIKLQHRFFTSMVNSAREEGIMHSSYCRFIQSSTGLPSLDYREPNTNNPDAVGGCLANIGQPTPDLIKAKRMNQPYSKNILKDFMT
jgi:DNA repair photolyase